MQPDDRPPGDGAPPPPPPVTPGPLGVGTVILGFFIAFFAAQVIGAVAVGAAVGILLATGSVAVPALDDPQALIGLVTHPFPLLTAAVASSVAFVGTAWGTCAITRRPARSTLGLVPAPLVTCVVAVVGVAALGLLIDELVHLFRDLLPGWTFGALEGFDDAAKAGGVVTRLLAITCMTLVPGFCEEVFFRGFFQRSLVFRLGPLGGVLFASLAFGFVHLDPPQALGATFTGLYLGWVAHSARSIVPAIAAHVANNALAYLGSNVPALSQFGSGGRHYPIGLLVGAAVLAAAAVLLVRFQSARGAASAKN